MEEEIIKVDEALLEKGRIEKIYSRIKKNNKAVITFLAFCGLVGLNSFIHNDSVVGLYFILLVIVFIILGDKRLKNILGLE